MKEPRISDIPSIKKILEDARNMATVKRAMPFFRPVLKLFGVEVEKIDDAFANIDDLVQQASELASIPDRFNDLFASRGWIIYDFLNLRVAKSAVEKAEAGHIDEAETDLVNYYDSETVKWHLLRMKTIEAFRPRMQLANKPEFGVIFMSGAQIQHFGHSKTFETLVVYLFFESCYTF